MSTSPRINRLSEGIQNLSLQEGANASSVPILETIRAQSLIVPASTSSSTDSFN